MPETVEIHVLHEMRESLLVVILQDRSGIDHKPQLDVAKIQTGVHGSY